MGENKIDYLKLLTVIGVIFLTIALLIILKIAIVITLPLVLSVFLYFMVKPLVSKLEKKNVPNWLSILIAMLLLVLILFFVVMALIKIIGILTTKDNINWVIERTNLFFSYISSNAKFLEKNQVNLSNLLGSDYFNSIRSIVLSASTKFLSILSQLVLILIFVLFLLLERKSLSKKMLTAFRGVDNINKVRMFRNINTSISKYLLIKTIISLITAILFYIVCLVAGIKFSFVWAILTFVLNFIPTIGSAVATLALTFMAALQFFPSWYFIGAIFVILIVIQNLMGSYIEPKISGEQLNLSPFIILVSLSLWGYIWGIVGMFLAIPITSTIQIICANIDSLNHFAVFLSTGKTVDTIIKNKTSFKDKFKMKRNSKN